MSGLTLDLKHAARGLLKAPAFTLAAVLTLALGIGANSAMFSAIDALVIRPLPYPHPEQLVAVVEGSGLVEAGSHSFSLADFFDFRDHAGGFGGMAVYGNARFDLAGWGAPAPVMAGMVTAGYFEIFGIRPLAGTFFTRDQETPGLGHAAVISQRLWQRRFGGATSVVGQSVVLSGTSYTILGVAPASTPFPQADSPDVFVPLERDPKGGDRGEHRYLCLGRLKEGVGSAQAGAELKTLAAGLARQYPGTNQGISASLTDLHDQMAQKSGGTLMLLMGAVALFMLIAMANVASLFLARAAARRQDVAVRVALGATRFQLVRHFMAEGAVVALAGSLLGLGAAQFILAGLPAILPKAQGLEEIQAIHLSGATFLFTFGVLLVVVGLFAAAPLAAVKDVSPLEALGAGGRGFTRGAGRLRGLFVTAEVAMATVLLLASGLFLHSFLKVLHTDPGFRIHDITTFRVTLPDSRYPAETQLRAFQRELLGRISALPGVESVGTAWVTPGSRAYAETVFHEGATQEIQATWPGAAVDIVDGGYFETLGIRMKAGRAIASTDTETTARVMVVNDAFARTFLPGGSALGRHLLVGIGTDTTPSGALWEIVGIAGDTRSRGLDRPPPPRMYLPQAQTPSEIFSLVIRSRASAKALEGPIRQQLAAVDPQLAADHYGNLETLSRDLLSDRRSTMILFGAFAVMALALGAIGIYGILAYSVAQRLREVGIRMALGARGAQILGLVIRQGIGLVALGLGFGFAAYLALGRVLSHLVVDLETSDAATLAAVPALLAAVGLLACVIPALRAARVDPAVALRNE